MKYLTLCGIFVCIALVLYSFVPLMLNRKMNLTVFCSASNSLDQVYIEQTRAIISKLDVNKIRVIYGGQTAGLMGVVAKTFSDNGGEVIGINYDKFYEPNANSEYMYDNLDERETKMIDMGDAFLVLPGGVGTTLELLEVLVKNNIGDFQKNKKVYIYNANGFYDHLLQQLSLMDQEKFIGGGISSLSMVVSSNMEEISSMINKGI